MKMQITYSNEKITLTFDINDDYKIKEISGSHDYNCEGDCKFCIDQDAESERLSQHIEDLTSDIYDKYEEALKLFNIKNNDYEYIILV